MSRELLKDALKLRHAQWQVLHYATVEDCARHRVLAKLLLCGVQFLQDDALDARQAIAGVGDAIQRVDLAATGRAQLPPLR